MSYDKSDQKKIFPFLFVIGIIGVILILQQKAMAWDPLISVYLSNVPDYAPRKGDSFTVSATANKQANIIRLYVGGVLKKTVYNTNYLSYKVDLDSFDLDVTVQIKARAWCYEPYSSSTDIEYTTVGPWFGVPDPEPFSNNLGSDDLRHPNDPMVYKAQMEILYQHGYSWAWPASILDKQFWLEIMWSYLSDFERAPYQALDNSPWYTDRDIAVDFLDNYYFDGQNDNDPEKYPNDPWDGYDCSNYAVFVSGLARSVGLPSRIWSIVDGGGIWEHMIAEIYNPDRQDINSGWWAFDLGHEDGSRVNWESWIDDPDYFRDIILCRDGSQLPIDVEYVTLIWDIFDPNLAEQDSHQPKAWLTTDSELPDGYWTPDNPNDFYGIDVVIGFHPTPPPPPPPPPPPGGY